MEQTLFLQEYFLSAYSNPVSMQCDKKLFFSIWDEEIHFPDDFQMLL